MQHADSPPFVVAPRGTRLSRPSEVVLDILPLITKPFTKEDGEIFNVVAISGCIRTCDQSVLSMQQMLSIS